MPGQPAETLEYVVSLRGGSEAAADLRRLEGAVGGVGGHIRSMGADSERTGGKVQALTGHMKGLVAGLGFVTAGYAAYNAAKGAINYTHELAEGTSTLVAATGMSTEASSRWVGVAHVLGVQSNALGTTFGKLAGAVKTQIGEHDKAGKAVDKHSDALTHLRERQALALKIGEEHAAGMKNEGKATEYLSHLREKQALAYKQAAEKEGEGHEGAGALKTLGIDTKFLASHQHDMAGIMLEVVDRLGKYHGGVDKASVLTKIFGRSWQALSPLLLEGKGHLEELLGAAQEFGVELHGNVTEKIDEYRKAQIRAKLAGDGLRLGFSELAMGPLSLLLKGFANLQLALRTGDWTKFDKSAEQTSQHLGQIVDKAAPHLIEAGSKIGPVVLKAMWHGFQSASLGGEVFMASLLLRKFGLAGPILGGIAKTTAKGFVRVFATTAAEGAGEMAVAGTTLGAAFETAFAAAAVIGIAAVVAYGAYKLGHMLRGAETAEDVTPSGKHMSKSETDAFMADQRSKRLAGEHAAHAGPRSSWAAGAREQARYKREHPGHMAAGGSMRHPGMVEVGEYGPEMLSLPEGSKVTPLDHDDLAHRDIVVNVAGRELLRINAREAMMAAAAGAS